MPQARGGYVETIAGRTSARDRLGRRTACRVRLAPGLSELHDEGAGERRTNASGYVCEPASTIVDVQSRPLGGRLPAQDSLSGADSSTTRSGAAGAGPDAVCGALEVSPNALPRRSISSLTYAIASFPLPNSTSSGRLRSHPWATIHGTTQQEFYFLYSASLVIGSDASSTKEHTTHPEAHGFAFLTNHGKALILIAQDPQIRIRDIARMLDITERATQSIVSDLDKAGYVERQRVGRRNNYSVSTHLPLGLPTQRDTDIESLLAIIQGS